MTQDVFKRIAALRRDGQVHKALALLRALVSSPCLEPESVERAGRLIRAEIERGSVKSSLRIRLLGQCTTSWLVTSLTAVAWAQSHLAWVEDAAYDNVVQDLLGAAGAVEPWNVVLVPWNQRLLGGSDRPGPTRVEDELAFWRQVWCLVQERLGARLVQVGYDCAVVGAGGYHLGSTRGGDVDLVRQVNAALRADLPAGAFFVDLEQAAGAMGRETFYDPRRYFWTKQPFSEAGTLRLAEHVWAGIRAVTTGPKKVLVLDLDNTLWSGEVGETGPLGVGLGATPSNLGPEGEAYLAFQAHVKRLAERGVMLAVASKNNPADAREPFAQNPAMLLKLDDFAAFEAGWEPKVEMLGRIARTLNLSLDSFVFFDDSAAEREQVRQLCPEVAVVDVPGDPAEYVRSLEAGLWFEAVTVTQADRQRAVQYTVEGKRRELQSPFTSMDEYLRSLQMRAEVQPITEAQIERVVQLLSKTNQFNLTSRRHDAVELRKLLAVPRSVAVTLRAADKFGDYGLVAVLLAVPLDDPLADAARIDTWLMSCRVIGRTLEHFLFGVLQDQAATAGYRRLVGEYIPTKKNAVVAGLYDELGFRRVGERADGSIEFEMILSESRRPTTFVRSGV